MEREQVMSKLLPKNNTFSFRGAGWRRPKTILGEKRRVEITEEGSSITSFASAACARIQKKKQKKKRRDAQMLKSEVFDTP